MCLSNKNYQYHHTFLKNIIFAANFFTLYELDVTHFGAAKDREELWGSSKYASKTLLLLSMGITYFNSTAFLAG